MKIGYCVGVFDLLHYGHKNILNYSINNCDKLIIGIHTDIFVKNYKRKPCENENIRRTNVINYLNCDKSNVILINDNHIDLINKYGINIIFHGNDWEIEGYKKQIRYYDDGMDKLGIKLELIPYTKGISTSNIISNNIRCLKTKQCFLFDLDNTLVLNNKPKIFAKDIIDKLIKQKKDYYIVTNNNRYSPITICKQLNSYGIKIKQEYILSSLKIIGDYLKNKFNKIYIWGTDDAIEYIKKLDIIIDDIEPEVVVILYKNKFNYQDLTKLCGLIQKTPYIVGNIDKTYPDKKLILPDTGSIAKLVKYVNNKEPLMEFGKPNIIMLDNILNKYNKESIIFIGDSLLTDKKLCVNSNIDFIHLHTDGDISNLGVLCDYLN